MRISELARHGGVSVPTVKYYLRTGLLSPGVRTARNQAVYGDAHLRRLRLVRTLREIGGLSIKAARELLAATDQPGPPGAELLAALHLARGRVRHRAPADLVGGPLRRELAAVVARHGRPARSHDRALDRLADICLTARLLEVPEVHTMLEAYADAAARLADCDVMVTRRLVERLAPLDPHHCRVTEAVTAAVVLGHAVATVLHGVAREAALTRLFAERSGRS